MDPVIAVAIASLSLGASGSAIVLAFRAADRAQRAVLDAAGSAFSSQPTAPTRDERIAWARGHIEAAKGAELALELHREELPAALLLAQYRPCRPRRRQAKPVGAWLRASAAAVLAGVHRTTISVWIAQGIIPDNALLECGRQHRVARWWLEGRAA